MRHRAWLALLAGLSILPVPALGQGEAGTWFEAGLGAGTGTGRFGAPSLAPLVAIGRAGARVALGVEWISLFRREAYADGGFFGPGTPPPPPRTRTITRWAVSGVARIGGRAGPFAKGGLGIGGVRDIDTSYMDSAPLRPFPAGVATLGVGYRWRMGGLALVPRADLLIHAGARSRASGVVAVAVAFLR